MSSGSELVKVFVEHGLYCAVCNFPIGSNATYCRLRYDIPRCEVGFRKF